MAPLQSIGAHWKGFGGGENIREVLGLRRMGGGCPNPCITGWSRGTPDRDHPRSRDSGWSAYSSPTSKDCNDTNLSVA